VSIQARSLLRERVKLTSEIGRGPEQVASKVTGSRVLNLSASGYCPLSMLIRYAESSILVDCASDVLIGCTLNSGV
jgi:hypothetical protein